MKLRPTTGNQKWLSFSPRETTLDGRQQHVQITLAGQELKENRLVRNLNEEDDPVRGQRWYAEYEDWYLGAAAGASWPTLATAKTALRRALGAMAETEGDGITYSPPIPRLGLKGPTIRIFLDGEPLVTTIEYNDNDGRNKKSPWHIDDAGEPKLQEAAKTRYATLKAARAAIERVMAR